MTFHFNTFYGELEFSAEMKLNCEISCIPYELNVEAYCGSVSRRLLQNKGVLLKLVDRMHSQYEEERQLYQRCRTSFEENECITRFIDETPQTLPDSAVVVSMATEELEFPDETQVSPLRLSTQSDPEPLQEIFTGATESNDTIERINARISTIDQKLTSALSDHDHCSTSNDPYVASFVANLKRELSSDL